MQKIWVFYLFMPLKLEFATELRLESPLSLVELVSTGEVFDSESRPKSTFTAESGLSGSGLLRLALARFLAALLRSERRELSICGQVTKLIGTHRGLIFHFTSTAYSCRALLDG